MLRLVLTVFARPRRKKCNCCDRAAHIEHKALLYDGKTLLGDLELCPDCAAAFSEVLQAPPEQVEGASEKSMKMPGMPA
ncbi:MAG: hypothetical protein PWP65_1710 [Clostridia bacterium]|nr:hypothetical protein [Clostridia bacterium]